MCATARPGGFCCEIGADVTGKEHRGAHVDKVEGLDDMLLFALRLWWYTGGIFEIELPALHRFGTFRRLAEVRQTRGNASLFSQEAINGARGAGQAYSRLLQALITSQAVQDRLGTWGASQSESPLVANIRESIHHHRVELRGWMVRGSRETS